VPPETSMLFKALVVTAVCLIQSPAFRAKVFQWRRRPGASPPPTPAPAEKAEVAA